MKTFVDFITEAPTEAQAAKMAPDMAPEKRRAALEKNARNQARRDTPITPQDKVKRPPQKKLAPSNSSALANRPADKGASIVRHRNQEVKDREDAKSSAKQRLASGSAGKPKLSPMSPDRKKASADKQRDELRYNKELKKAKDKPGFGGGLKKSFGGDLMMNTKTDGKDDPEKIAKRRDARRELGQKTGNAIKSVPGKVTRAGVGLAKKAIDSTKGDSVGTSSSGNLGGPSLSQGGRTSK